jgi:hypothetical protein
MNPPAQKESIKITVSTIDSQRKAAAVREGDRR